VFRRLEGADQPALEEFLVASPAERSLATALVSRYGFTGPVQYHAHSSEDGIDALITIDRGRALLLGAVADHLEAAERLLLDAPLRSAMAKTQTMDRVLGSPSRLGVAWRHRPQVVEQQMVLNPTNLQLLGPPPGIEISTAGPADCAAAAAALNAAPGWGESAQALTHRLERGSLLLASRRGAIVGAVWANAAAMRFPRLSRLWVDEQHTGMGVASALSAAAASHLLAAGAEAVVAWVPQRDQRARQVLGKAGFVPLVLWKKVLLASDTKTAGR